MILGSFTSLVAIAHLHWCLYLCLLDEGYLFTMLSQSTAQPPSGCQPWLLHLIVHVRLKAVVTKLWKAGREKSGVSRTPFIKQPWHGLYAACSSTGSPPAGGHSPAASLGEGAHQVSLRCGGSCHLPSLGCEPCSATLQHSTQRSCIAVALTQAWSQKQRPQ